MEVKVLSSRTEMGLECAVNEFLSETRHKIIDIKFSTAGVSDGDSMRIYGISEYSAMIVYDEAT